MARKSRAPALKARARTPASAPPPVTRLPFLIVGVGASAGGLEALTELFTQLPERTGMAFVVIQHLDPTRESLLADALRRVARLPVDQATNRLELEPDHVYVIPPGFDLRLRGNQLLLRPRARKGTALHLPIDSFFRSLAAERGPAAIGVVLSGTGSDGTEGLRAIRGAGGITLAQEPVTARSPGMPRSAIEAGVVDLRLPLPALAEELARLRAHSWLDASQAAGPSETAVLRNMFALVRSASGVDLGEYKEPTVRRRMARRMALRRVATLAEYLELLRTDEAEVRALQEEVLIHVTSFFRDPAAFEGLQRQAIPAILAAKADGGGIRAWVAGCATGEEVYSIAICLLEGLAAAGRSLPIQLFGSDVSERAIVVARAGLFSEASLRGVSPERRRRWFTGTDGGFRINKEVRDHCVFVRHDVARDPPFTRLDLVSCRNVLIYFDQPLQRRLIPTFHFCLNDPGFLLLGKSEGLAGYNKLFLPVAGGAKLFSRAAVPRVAQAFLRPEPRTPVQGPRKGTAAVPERQVDLGKHLDRLLVARYAPPGILINGKLEILQFRGETGPYLRLGPGQAQTDLLKLARGGLLKPLRALLDRATRTGAPVRATGVEVLGEGEATRRFDLAVVPVAGMPLSEEPLYIVLFEPGLQGKQAGERRARQQRRPALVEEEAEMLRHELAATREYLSSLVEEHSRSNIELGSANEELVSGNEELQSLNEELETAKEELQSTNEELTTVNDELNARNHEVTQVNTDLVNLLGTVDFPILILDRQQRIRRFTPSARSLLNVLPSDLGRPLGDIRLNIDLPDLAARITEVTGSGKMHETQVQDRSGRWFRLQVHPYRGSDEAITGSVISLIDIHELKRLLGVAERSRAEAEGANRAKDEFLAVLSHELRTPLATMTLQAQLLRRGPTDETKLNRALELIERSAGALARMIEDLLDVSRIVTGKLRMELHSVDLAAVVREALDGVAQPASRKGVALESNVQQQPGTVSGDPDRLLQVVSNLLLNAIKFTPAKGRVAVDLSFAGDDAVLRVTDTGNGIAEAFLPRLFKRFSQEDASITRAKGGLGIGLAIVHHLVGLHGGNVRAESPGVGQGSTFTVTLPYRRGATGGARLPEGDRRITAEGDGRRRLAGARVLVVDDDRESLEVVAEMLGAEGALVELAESAAAAREAITRQPPDVVVSDLAMPGEDGLSLMRWLRDRGGEVGATPAVALTALAGAEDRARALEAGYELHLAKPVSLNQLADAVGALASRRSREPRVKPAAG